VRQPQNNETAAEEHAPIIESAPVLNTVALNSCRGTIGTDRVPWAKPSATLLGKDLFYCAYHESSHILDGGAGLSEDHRNQFMKDMYLMIYHISSKEELHIKISACRDKYGHNKKSLDYIKSLDGNKKHLCHAFTQGLFTLTHTATQRSQGFNDKIKGHTSLKDMLSDADLVTLHDHVDTLNRANDKRAMDELAKLRNTEMCWSSRYESAVQESICLSTNVESCDDIGNGCFRVKQRDMAASSTVNTQTKIIHLGHCIPFLLVTVGSGHQLSCRACALYEIYE
jgi:hypothetical protein